MTIMGGWANVGSAFLSAQRVDRQPKHRPPPQGPRSSPTPSAATLAGAKPSLQNRHREHYEQTTSKQARSVHRNISWKAIGGGACNASFDWLANNRGKNRQSTLGTKKHTTSYRRRITESSS
jgi:hypothetical protein